MKDRIKAIFFDVDSTLYYHGCHDILPSTRAALNALHKQGIRIGIATSRCHSEMRNLPAFFRCFPFAGIISDGGALVMEGKEIVEMHPLPKPLVRKIAALAKTYQRTLRYSTIQGNYFDAPPHQKDKDDFFRLYLNTPTIQPYQDEDALNLLFYTQDPAEREELQKILQGVSCVAYEVVCEINAARVNKCGGVRALAQRWGIEMSEIMSFGDGANDVELLRECGIGVAMGNGCAAVKQVADFVTKRIEDDGIAHALRHYGLLPAQEKEE